MNKSNSLERDPCPGKFDDDTAPSTIAEGACPVRINPRLREKNIKCDLADLQHAFNIGQQGQYPSQHCFRLSEKLLTTVIIHCQDYITARGIVKLRGNSRCGRYRYDQTQAIRRFQRPSLPS